MNRFEENDSFKLFSEEAESSVIGSILIDNSIYDEVSSIVSHEHFANAVASEVFKVSASLIEKGETADPISVATTIESNGGEESCFSYATKCVKETPTTSNAKTYAQVVYRRAFARSIMSAAAKIQSLPKEVLESPDILSSKAESIIKSAVETGTIEDSSTKRASDTMGDVVEKIMEAFDSDGNYRSGIPTGFSDLDDKTSGLQNGDLIIVAGRPSMGKTSYSLNIAENVAIKSKKTVAVFSLEMPAEQLVTRMISSLGGIDAKRLRDGTLEDDDFIKIESAAIKINDANIFIHDKAGITPSELRSSAKKIKDKHGLDLIVVDYLQLMSSGGEFEANSQAEVAFLSKSLKGIARDFNVPVIALSQLNRSLEQRPNKRPIMSDLRGSGSVEQDADVIMFVYRDEVYNADSEDKGTAEIIIGKQRNGPIGMVRLVFRNNCTRFENMSPVSYDSF